MNGSAERAPDREPDGESMPRYASLLDRVIASWQLVAVGVVLLLTGLGLILAVLGVQFPRWTVPVFVTVVATGPYAYFLSAKARQHLWNPGWVYGVKLVGEDDQEGGIWRWQSDGFRRSSVEKGSLDWVSPSLFFARDIDTAQSAPGDRGATLRGTWRGTLEDRKLMWSMQKVAECRGQLLDDAIRGFVIESSAWVVVYEATRAATDEMRQMMEDGTLPDKGEGIDAAVTDAISDTNLGSLVEDSQDLDLPDGWGAEDGAFTDPLGSYEYSQDVQQEAPERPPRRSDDAAMGHASFPGRQEVVGDD